MPRARRVMSEGTCDVSQGLLWGVQKLLRSQKMST